jgi:hypothetical protein
VESGGWTVAGAVELGARAGDRGEPALGSSRAASMARPVELDGGAEVARKTAVARRCKAEELERGTERRWRATGREGDGVRLHAFWSVETNG